MPIHQFMEAGLNPIYRNSCIRTIKFVKKSTKVCRNRVVAMCPLFWLLRGDVENLTNKKKKRLYDEPPTYHAHVRKHDEIVSLLGTCLLNRKLSWAAGMKYEDDVLMTLPCGNFLSAVHFILSVSFIFKSIKLNKQKTCWLLFCWGARLCFALSVILRFYLRFYFHSLRVISRLFCV